MHTVIETLLFQRQWPLYWTEEERGAFAARQTTQTMAMLSPHRVVCEKFGGDAQDQENGGVRIIYFTRTEAGEIVLLTLYANSKTGNITGQILMEIRRALEI